MATLDELENRIRELETWKAEREKQQIIDPLDKASLDILQKYFIQVIGSGVFTRPSGAIGDFYWFVRNNSIKQRISLYPPLLPVTADPATDTFTANNHGYVDGNQIFFVNSGPDFNSTTNPPTPISTAIPYYILNATSNTFQVEAVLGGGAVDITDFGTGSTYITPFV